LITDKKVVTIGCYISDPLDYLGQDRFDELEDEFKNGFWEFDLLNVGIQPYTKDGEECFGGIGDISHWMPIPYMKNETK